MITVSILINGHPLYTRSAVNVSERVKIPRELRLERGDQYQLDDGSTLYHHPNGGAVLLAIQMLETIDEVGIEK